MLKDHLKEVHVLMESILMTKQIWQCCCQLWKGKGMATSLGQSAIKVILSLINRVMSFHYKDYLRMYYRLIQKLSLLKTDLSENRCPRFAGSHDAIGKPLFVTLPFSGVAFANNELFQNVFYYTQTSSKVRFLDITFSSFRCHFRPL